MSAEAVHNGNGVPLLAGGSLAWKIAGCSSRNSMPEHPALVFDIPQPAVAAARTAEELVLLICVLKNC